MKLYALATQTLSRLTCYRRNFSALPVTELKHNSVEIDLNTVSLDANGFSVALDATLQDLRLQERSAVFLKVPILQSHFIIPSREKGFVYHHAEGDNATLLLWLAKGDNKVPTFATHHVGVGGVVVSGQDILVVKEHAPMNKNWKFPGGYAELGEHFGDAAVREVWEETRVLCEFSHVLTMRHSHEEQFGRSNMYVVCMLNALSKDITIDDEIEDARWMTLDEFRSQPLTPMTGLIADMVSAGHMGFAEIQMQYPLAGRLPFKLYHSR